MEIKYKPEKQLTAVLDIDDIGNCAIEAYNDLNEYYYLLIKTVLGKSKVYSFGPIVEDGQADHFDLSFYTMDYNIKKLQKTVFAFLNNFKTNIEAAIVIDFEQALTKITSLDVYLD